MEKNYDKKKRKDSNRISSSLSKFKVTCFGVERGIQWKRKEKLESESLCDKAM